MAGQETEFASGVREKDGTQQYYHAWPIVLFKQHFAGLEDAQENWKAAVYAWGGPQPSKLERVDVEFDIASGRVLLIYTTRMT